MPPGEPCALCADADAHWGTGAEWGKGWNAAMRYAHHAHREKTYRGHASANGVLGAGPDTVIVDGDWLALLEENANHWLPRFDRWVRDWWRTVCRTGTHRVLRAVCWVTGGHRYGEARYFSGKVCTRCHTVIRTGSP